MQLKQLKFSRVLDMYAFRIIVKDASKCYQILGIIHNLYKPLPGRFKDYIALPKSNGYQSLHSILFGPNKILIEVQIRSEDMDFMSEYGIAAHWHYKSEDNTPANLASNWLGSLLEIQQRSGNSKDFLEDTKNDLFPSEVFVFTPQGDIVQLPYGATVLDFAYAIHTKIGNHMVKAKIDKRKASFAEKLKSGQTIEIFTHKKSKPDPSWLKIAMTAKAKSSIKTKLKENSSAELIQLGKFLVQNAIDYHADSFKIDRQAWENCLKDLKCNNKSELYIKIALSEILVLVVLNKLVLKDNDAPLVKSIVINKTQEKAISFANCCYPVPGDKVASILTTNKGLVLHRVICSNLIRAKQKNEQWLDVDWRPDYSEEFKTSIRVYVENRRGMLASIVNVISKIGINIENLEVEEKDNYVKAFKLLINVSGVNQLNQVLHNIKSLEYVASIERV
jgi:GTP pyrophosphokinase